MIRKHLLHNSHKLSFDRTSLSRTAVVFKIRGPYYKKTLSKNPKFSIRFPKFILSYNIKIFVDFKCNLLKQS